MLSLHTFLCIDEHTHTRNCCYMEQLSFLSFARFMDIEGSNVKLWLPVPSNKFRMYIQYTHLQLAVTVQEIFEAK